MMFPGLHDKNDTAPARCNGGPTIRTNASRNPDGILNPKISYLTIRKNIRKCNTIIAPSGNIYFGSPFIVKTKTNKATVSMMPMAMM